MFLYKSGITNILYVEEMGIYYMLMMAHVEVYNGGLVISIKVSLGSKHILFSHFIITEPTELKLSDIVSPGNSNAVHFFRKFCTDFPTVCSHLGLNVACDISITIGFRGLKFGV